MQILPRRDFILTLPACCLPRRWLARAESVAVIQPEAVPYRYSALYALQHWDDIIEDAALEGLEMWKEAGRTARQSEPQH